MNNQLQDLLMPPKQADPAILLWLVLFIIICFLGLAFWRWNKYRSQVHIIAQKRLKDLLNQPDKTAEETKKAALKVATILSKGLGINRLDQFQTDDVQEWKAFHKRLNTACYSACNDKADMQKLINDASNWLNKG